MNSNWICTNLEGSSIIMEHLSPLYEPVASLTRSVSFQARLKGVWAACSYVQCTGKIMKPFNGSLLNYFFFLSKLARAFKIKTAVCQVWHYFHQGSLPKCTKKKMHGKFASNHFFPLYNWEVFFSLNPTSTMSTETVKLSSYAFSVYICTDAFSFTYKEVF